MGVSFMYKGLMGRRPRHRLQLGESSVNTHSSFPGFRMSWFLPSLKKEAAS